MSNKCLACGKIFIPAKFSSTIGCPECTKKLSEEVRKGKWCKCIRCGKEYIAFRGDSLAGCRPCVFGDDIKIESRFEILDIREEK